MIDNKQIRNYNQIRENNLLSIEKIVRYRYVVRNRIHVMGRFLLEYRVIDLKLVDRREIDINKVKGLLLITVGVILIIVIGFRPTLGVVVVVIRGIPFFVAIARDSQEDVIQF